MLRPRDIPRDVVALIGTTSSSRINAMIRDTIQNSMDINDIKMSPDMKAALGNLRSFMFKQVYASDVALE